MLVRMLDRRSVLRGMGGVAVGLPLLEAMGAGSRQALAAPPARFMVSWIGTSLSTDSSKFNHVTPKTPAGMGYETTMGLQSLADLGVKEDVSVVSGLKFSADGFHFATIQGQLSGINAGEDRWPTGASSADQVVAKAIAGNTPIKVLPYRLQAVTQSANTGRFSFLNGTPVDAAVRLQAAYDRLFTGFSPPAVGAIPGGTPVLDQTDAKRRLSVLDFVKGDLTTLMTRVGAVSAADRMRLQQHWDQIRDLEKKLVPDSGTQPSDPGALGAGCRKPMLNLNEPAQYVKGATYGGSTTYNDEDRRGDVFADLIAIALACDQTRSVSYMLTEWKCYHNCATYVPGKNVDVHGLTHGGGSGGDPKLRGSHTALAVNFFVKQWAKVIKKCKEMPEAGKTLLDSCAFVVNFEGGFSSGNESHTTEGMISLLAGRAGGLKSGQHLVTQGKHPASVVVTAMNAVGVPGGLGKVTENIPGLLA